MQALKLLQPNLTNVTIPAAGVPVEILAILDPLSKTAQRVAPVLGFLQKTLGVGLKVGLLRNHYTSYLQSGRLLVKCFDKPPAGHSRAENPAEDPGCGSREVGRCGLLKHQQEATAAQQPSCKIFSIESSCHSCIS